MLVQSFSALLKELFRSHLPGGGMLPSTHFCPGGYILGGGKLKWQWQKKWKAITHALFGWWMIGQVSSAFQTPQLLFLKSTSAKFLTFMADQPEVNQPYCWCMKVKSYLVTWFLYKLFTSHTLCSRNTLTVTWHWVSIYLSTLTGAMGVHP